MKNLNTLLRIIIVFVLLSTTLFSQLKLTTYTDKDVYDYGETIILSCKVTNTADTTFEFFAPTYQSCQAEFSFNDFNSWDYTTCLTLTELLTFKHHHSKIYSWRIEPQSLGLPNNDGAQTIIGKYYFDLADTIYIQAPRFVGGEIRVAFNGSDVDSINSIRNQLNAYVIFGDHFGEVKDEVWQIEGFDIDSLIQIYSNDSIFITFEKSIGIMYEDIVDENPLDYYPLQVGNKWYYEVIYDPVWVIGSKTYYLIREVIGDSTYKNGKRYIEIKEIRSDTNSILTYFERKDSVNAQVYRLQYGVNNNEEYLVADFHLNLEESYSTFVNYLELYDIDSMYLKEESYKDVFYEKKDLKRFTKSFNNFNYDPVKYFSQSYSIGIGKTYQHKGFFEAYDEYHYLKAAYINGVKYGDTTLVGVNDNVVYQIPTNFSLSQNYPNPFNPTTTIEYKIPQDEKRETRNVKLLVYDVLGKEVATLVNENKKPGNYQVTFNAHNLASGIYYYRLSAGTFSETKKLILLK